MVTGKGPVEQRGTGSIQRAGYQWRGGEPDADGVEVIHRCASLARLGGGLAEPLARLMASRVRASQGSAALIHEHLSRFGTSSERRLLRGARGGELAPGSH